MTFWGGITRWANSPAVRRRAPVAASIVVHIVAGMVAVTMLAAGGRPDSAQRANQPREMVLEVTLVAIPGANDPATFPAAMSRGAPASLPSAGVAPPLGKPGAKEQQSTAPVEAGAADDSVSFGAPADGLARGLARVSGEDPCKAKYGPKPKECGTDWAAKGQASLMPATKAEQATYFAEYMPKCPWNVGCEGGEWISTNGTRSVGGPAPGSRQDHGSSMPMAAGAAGLGGLHDSVGRLGFNPDHFDRGFGD